MCGMPFTTRMRRERDPGPAGVHGPARVDPRTKDLTKRLKPGDIAVINHIDIERFAHALHTAPRDQATGCGKATLDCIANRR